MALAGTAGVISAVALLSITGYVVAAAIGARLQHDQRAQLCACVWVVKEWNAARNVQVGRVWRDVFDVGLHANRIVVVEFGAVDLELKEDVE